jgi:hypothetical protein
MDLFHIGEARADEHAAVGQPGEEAALARVRVALQLFGERLVAGRYAFEYQRAPFLPNRNGSRSRLGLGECGADQRRDGGEPEDFSHAKQIESR